MKNLLMDIGKGLLNLFDVSKILKEKLDSAKPGSKRAVAAIIVICLVCVAGVWLRSSGPPVTKRLPPLTLKAL